MATNSLIFSSPAGTTALAAGRNQIATFPVGAFSSIRIYAFVRPNTPQVTVYLINPNLHDHVGTDPEAGALAPSLRVERQQSPRAHAPAPRPLVIDPGAPRAHSSDPRPLRVPLRDCHPVPGRLVSSALGR